MIQKTDVSARLILLSVFVIAWLTFSPSVFGQTSTWNGGDGNWTDANWTGGQPTTTSTVLIDNGNPAISVVTLDVNAQVNNLILDGDDTLSFNGFPSSSVSLTLNNATLNGTTNINSGSLLTVQNGATNNGTINLSSALTFDGEINGSGTLSNGVSGLIQGNGVISVNTNNAGAPTLVSGGVFAQGGTLTFTGQVTNTGVMVGDTGNLVFTGQVTNTGVIQGGSGTTLILDGANVTGGGVNGEITAQNGATVSGAELGAGFLANPGATLTDGSVLTVAGTVTSVGGLILGSGGTGATITGPGTLANEDGIGGTGEIDTNITNNGGILVGLPISQLPGPPLAGSGTLVLGGAVTNTSSSIDIASGATLDLAGAQVNGGIIIGGLNGTVAGETLSGAIVSAENGAVLQNVTFDPEAFPFLGPQPSAFTLTGGSTLGLAGSTTVVKDVSLAILGTLNNGGGLGNSGALQINSGGVLNNTGSIIAQGGDLVVLGGGTFNNSGSLISDFSSSFGTFVNSSVVNTGTMSLSGDLVVIGGSLRNDGSITLTGGTLPGAPIPEPPPPLYVTSTGTLSGKGTVNGNVEMAGTMAPGDSPGTFTINGNYDQDASGTLDILLGGTGAGEFSILDVSELASLDGAVDFTAVNGFTPDAGDDFTFLLFGTTLGNFSGMDFTNWSCPVGDTCTDVLGLNSLTLDITGPGGSGGGGGTMATPEPSSLILLCTGLLGLIVLARRKQFGGARRTDRTLC